MPFRRYSVSTVAATLALLSLACGKTHSQGPQQGVVLPIAAPYPPAPYALDDPACQTSPAATTPLTSTTINAWTNGNVVAKTVTLHDTSSTSSLVSPTVSGTRYQDLYEQYCDLKLPEGHWCDDANGNPKTSWDLNEPKSPGPLRLCQDAHAYSRQSVEGVALTASYFLQQARDRYLHVAVGAKAPAAVALKVLPDFVTYYDNYDVNGQNERLETFLTHNLAYFPGSQMIAVFPETAAMALDEVQSGGGFFWESAFVLSHEFGHHIDYTRHGQVLNGIGLRWNPVAHSYDDLVTQAQGLAGPSDRSQAAGAMAEGFADMIAYYANGASNTSLVGIPGIGVNRDVGNATFEQDVPKTLTPEGLNILLGLAADTDHTDGSPSFADIHIVGAVIAHTADTVFSQLTSANPGLAKGSPEEVDQRYRLALAYMDAVVQGTAAMPLTTSGPAVLAPLSQALEQTTDAYLTSFALTGGDTAAARIRQEVCRTAHEAMPAMTTMPFANGNGC